MRDVVTQEACFVCGGNEFDAITAAYRHCRKCGHELLKTARAQGYMVNDPLDREDVIKVGMLDRFKKNVLHRFCEEINRFCLLDVGSSSGKFLLQNAGRFEKTIGIEVTPEAIKFSRNVLGLEVYESIHDVNANISVVTFWHSLEHIPADDMLEMLKGISCQMSPGGKVIVSVPNNKSIQYRLFRTAYAFFDVPHHIHQFSPYSLDCLFKRFGFSKVSRVPSWPYNVFGYIQSILNFLTGTHNYLYYRFKRRSIRPSPWKDMINTLFLPVAVPAGFTLALLDAAFPNQQGVLTLCYERRR